MLAADDHPFIAPAFAQALAAARAFEGATAPNPSVGCAILDEDGRLLALAAHRKAGDAHAEALAIARCRALRLEERIHTVVVTLEPCNHHGRTPPCTEAILATPARHVWFAAPDPNPSVAGGGAARLAAAGLAVRTLSDLPHADAPALARSAARLIAPFAKRVRSGLPWLVVKQALDAKGGMIPPAGRKTFTSRAALTVAHRLRRRADAIVTGSGTVLADLPLFTVRHVEDVPDKVRTLVLLDRRRRVPESDLAAARTRGFRVMVADDLGEALRALGSAGALEVLVEAGPRVTGHVLADMPWDEHLRIALDGQGRERLELRRPDGTSQEIDPCAWEG